MMMTRGLIESYKSELDDIDIDRPRDLTKNSNESGVLPELPEGNTYSPRNPLVPRISYLTPEDMKKHETDVVSCSDIALVNYVTAMKLNGDMRIEEIPDLPHVFKFTDAMEHCSQELRPVSLTQVVISRIELMNDKFSQESSNNLQFKVPESSLQLVERFKYSDIPEISSQELRPVGLMCTVVPRSQLVVKNICPMYRHTYALVYACMKNA